MWPSITKTSASSDSSTSPTPKSRRTWLAARGRREHRLARLRQAALHPVPGDEQRAGPLGEGPGRTRLRTRFGLFGPVHRRERDLEPGQNRRTRGQEDRRKGPAHEATGLLRVRVLDDPLSRQPGSGLPPTRVFSDSGQLRPARARPRPGGTRRRTRHGPRGRLVPRRDHRIRPARGRNRPHRSRRNRLSRPRNRRRSDRGDGTRPRSGRRVR